MTSISSSSTDSKGPRTALLFSGQGAQRVGMGQDLAATFPKAAALFQEGDQLLQLPLSQIMFEGPEAQLTQTSLCQPALYLHGLALFELLKEALPDFSFVAAAGLSLGEWTAHAVAGTFSPMEGLEFVAQRAAFMQESCEATDGGMAAIIGGEEEKIRELAKACDVDIANLNSPGQIVLSGTTSHIAHAVTIAKEYGARKAIPLTVAGAFHSRLMLSAYEKLHTLLSTTSFQEPSVPVIANISARPTSGEEAIRNTLADQVTGSVRWTESIIYMIEELGCERFIELGPGNVLAGLVNRIKKGREVISISNVESLEEALVQLKK